MAESKSWARRSDLRETGPAFHAFQHFRDLPIRARSLDRAYTWCQTQCPRDKNTLVSGPLKEAPEALPEPLKIATRNWKEWRKRFLWDLRVADFDSYVDEQERVDARAAVKAMKKRHASLAVAFLNKVVERIQSVSAADLQPGTMQKWLKEATLIERMSRDQPTEIVKQSSDTVDLSKLTDDELDTFIKLSEKASGGANE